MSLVAIGTIGLLVGAFGGITIGALGGLKISVPSWATKGHGLLNLACLFGVFLGLLLTENAVAVRAWVGVGVLTIALIGGLIIFRVLFPKKAPRSLIVLHGCMAVVGLVLLLPASGLF